MHEKLFQGEFTVFSCAFVSLQLELSETVNYFPFFLTCMVISSEGFFVSCLSDSQGNH